MTTVLNVPYPPTLNRYYRYVTGLRRVLISAEGRAYREAVREAINKAAQTDGLKTLSGRLEVVIHVSPPDRRRRDLDNVLKALLDSLTYAGVWVDDSQIDKLEINRIYAWRGRVLVAVTEIEGAADGQKLPARKAVRGKNATRGSGDTEAHEGASPRAREPRVP